MKIRNGFVSNSSTSSFVAVGFDIAESDLSLKEILFKLEASVTDAWIEHIIKWKERVASGDFNYYTQEKLDAIIKEGMNDEFIEDYACEFFNEEGMRILTGGEDGVEENEKVIANMIADGIDDESLESHSFSISDIKDEFDKLENLRKEIASNVEMKIYIGTRMC